MQYHQITLALAATSALALGQDSGRRPTFGDVTQDAGARLEASLAELSALREAIAAEKVPMAEELTRLELELSEARRANQAASRLLDTRTLDLTNLRAEVQRRKDEASYLGNLLTEHGRNFESRLHIAEVQRYEAPLQRAKLATEDTNLSQSEVFAAQVALIEASLGRAEDALGGTRFDGAAVDSAGLVNEGTFALVGPVALFRSKSGAVVGTAEQRMSTEPIVVAFADPLDTAAAATLVADGAGTFPLDTTLGDAHKMAATKETLVEEFHKGGPVMFPIFAMAAAALLVALLKWASLAILRKPRRKSVNALLDAVGRRDVASAERIGSELSERGPLGRMLWTGVQNLGEPRELVEEAMYEDVLTAKHRVGSFLPFVAICAASAPLLGLLGTVTGIINTFKLLTVFGSGDVKSISGGISEALITTKWGLIVAIPSLLLHAFLARKARGIVANMEATAVAFVNRLAKTEDAAEATNGVAHGAGVGPDAGLVRAEVGRILTELLGPLNDATDNRPKARPTSLS